MKAVFYKGDKKITVGESRPVQPEEGEVQIKVSHCGICGTDLHIYHGVMDHRVTFPQILGHEMSGIVEAVGNCVENVAVGDRVTVRPLSPCGHCPACEAGHSHICHNLAFLGIETQGAFQTYWNVPAYTIHKLPESVSLKHGALIEPLAVACHDVRTGEIQAGEYVVVIGGGPIGALIAMVARQKGATVKIAEINPYRIKLLQQLGFEVVDSKNEDLEKIIYAETNGAGADVVFEVTSSQTGAQMMTKLLRTRGRIVIVGIFGQAPQVDLFQFFWKELKMFGARVYEPEDFDQAIALAASGELPLDQIITNVYPLENLEQGLKEMEGGGNVMKVLLTCS